MAKTSPMLIIAVVLIVALLSGSALITAFSDLFGQGWETWQDLWDFGNVGAQGTSSIGLTINYKDGSSKDFEDGGFSILPLTISDSGGEVQSFIITVGMRVTHTFSHVSRYVMKIVDFDAKVTNSEGGLVGYLVQDYTQTKSLSADWVSGESKGISMGEFEATQLESIIASKPYGTYTLQMSADVSLDLTSDSGETATQTGSGSASWTFSYTSEGEIQSLSVTINTYPYH